MTQQSNRLAQGRAPITDLPAAATNDRLALELVEEGAELMARNARDSGGIANSVVLAAVVAVGIGATWYFGREAQPMARRILDELRRLTRSRLR
jgi:hypothetical protein